jgi:hypothetical protein
MVDVSMITQAFLTSVRNWFWFVGWSIIGLILLAQLCWTAYRWVCDAGTVWEKNRNRKVFCGKVKGMGEDEWGLLLFLLFIAAVVVLIAGAIWPLSVIATAIFTVMYLLRGSLRFKRDVDEALDSKAEKGHTH